MTNFASVAQDAPVSVLKNTSHLPLSFYDNGDDFFYTYVWTGERIIKVCTYEFGALPGDRMEPSPELFAEALAWAEAEIAKREAQESLAHEYTVRKGMEVVVFKGRKVMKGTKGIVMWVGVDKFGNERAGLKVEGESALIYTATANLQPIL